MCCSRSTALPKTGPVPQLRRLWQAILRLPLVAVGRCSHLRRVRELDPDRMPRRRICWWLRGRRWNLTFITVKEARELYGSSVVDNADWCVSTDELIPIVSTAPGWHAIRLVQGSHPPAVVLEDVLIRAAHMAEEELQFTKWRTQRDVEERKWPRRRKV